jgi:aminoglycoside phosphotransferase (APT) family kinase protein
MSIDPKKFSSELHLPTELELDSAELNAFSETNSVYFCKGRFRGEFVEAFLKIADRAAQSLENERSMLDRLRSSDIPVPSVIASGQRSKPFLLLSKIPGVMLWDRIDPRRPHYERSAVLKNLRAYGALLARIHALEFDCPAQRRARFEGLIGEENVADAQFKTLVAWIDQNRPERTERTFVHGDFNTGNVLLDADAVSGVIDWEFAGLGWKEYELAWALRARIHFMNSEAEREAILSGYQTTGRFDAGQLRWCEVLNYLHFAYWSLDSNPEYRPFALARAEAAATAGT